MILNNATVAAKKKAESRAKAQKIVEELIDGTEDASHFLAQLRWINQCHYQDIVEERAITKTCGYPLCRQAIGVVSKKKFHISSRQNKVYDITDRKNFCSNQCYKASFYLKSQLLTTPIWLRDTEKVPGFALYTSSAELIGEEVNFNVETVKVADTVEESSAAPPERVTTELNCNVAEAVEPKLWAAHAVHSNVEVVERRHPATESTIASQPIETTAAAAAPVGKPEPTWRKESVYAKAKAKTKTESKPKAETRQKNMSDAGFVRNVESCLREWLTIDTLSHLIGFHRVKSLMKERGENYTGPTADDPLVYEKYLALCRKLKILEMEEERAAATTGTTPYETPSKPLPDFEALKEQAEEMQIKVKSFYRGDTKVSFKEDTKSEETSESDSRPNALPPIHSHAKKVIRRNIVLDKLKIVLPDLVQILSLRFDEVFGEVRTLVGTFNLTARNITFKPLEWNLIALVLIKLLSLENEKLQCTLREKSKYINTMLMSYQLETHYLDLLCTWLTDFDQILRTEQVPNAP